MLNAKGEPVLLEVNHTPSFATDTPLDHKIKFNLIKDSLELMNVNVQTKTELFNKAKELNQQRLLTGKRQIFEGKEREEIIAEAQAARDDYEDKHLGGFQRIFPVKDEEKMKRYGEIIEVAQKVYAEENGSIRMKMMEKEAKKLIREDFKQRKREKAELKEKEAKEGKEDKETKEGRITRERKDGKQIKSRERETAS
jgi:tubulin polyglutamylase TTLL6/13